MCNSTPRKLKANEIKINNRVEYGCLSKMQSYVALATKAWASLCSSYFYFRVP